MRSDRPHAQAITRPLPGHELAQPYSFTEEARLIAEPLPPSRREWWLVKEMIWLAPHDGCPGRSSVFCDAGIQFCQTIKSLFKRPLRQITPLFARFRAQARRVIGLSLSHLTSSPSRITALATESVNGATPRVGPVTAFTGYARQPPCDSLNWLVLSWKSWRPRANRPGMRLRASRKPQVGECGQEHSFVADSGKKLKRKRHTFNPNVQKRD